MADVLVRPATADDADQLYLHMRDADRAECEAYGMASVWDGVRSNVRRSWHAWTAEVDGQLAAVMGVTPLSLMGGMGSPWMLGTPLLDQHSRILVRLTPHYIGKMLAAFPHLVNLVHAGNHTSVRWLQRLGFVLHPPVPFGLRGEMFHPFEMKA